MDDVWLILHEKVLAALGIQNKRLVSLLKKLVNTLKKAKVQSDESAAEIIVEDLKDLVESIKVKKT